MARGADIYQCRVVEKGKSSSVRLKEQNLVSRVEHYAINES